MAGKKYKPALYELVGKGRVKPDDKGALVTPKWFYGEGEPQVETEPVRQEPKVIIHRGPQVPQPAAVQEERKASEPIESGEAQAEKDYGVHLGKNIRIWAPWWVMALAVLGLVLGFLVMYRIGQATVDQAEPTTSNAGMKAGGNSGDTGPSEELKNIRNGPVQKGVLTIPKPTVSPTGTGGRSQTPPRTVTTGSLCLILCGSDKQRDLIDVQEYFSKKGILTRIGQLERRYVLYTAQGVDSRTGPEASRLKAQAVQLGEGYNQEKPRTAAVFLASTFKTAYWVKRSAITRLD